VALPQSDVCTMSDRPDRQLAAKRNAAIRAVREVEDGMVVGLGSGSTTTLAIEALGERVRAGLRISGIPTSEASASLARRLGISLTDFARHRRIDLTIDGADQVARGSLDLVKGRGGALLREKIVASASDRMIVVADETKLVNSLGGATPLPLEIVPFGWELTIDRLAALGLAATLRLNAGQPFRSDGGNYIADCTIGETGDPPALERQLRGLLGVIATGLFIGMATRVIVGRETGCEIIDAPRRAS
jgi:ribose 5-phosphate isomerase A